MNSRKMPENIYHYTSNDALIKILHKKSLRMSARHHLNDKKEGKQFFALLKNHESQPSKERITAARQALSSLEFFVCCFSSKRDRLSQWRGYAANGTGVAIGFRTKSICAAIQGSHEALLYKVAYANKCHDLPTERANTINAILSSSGSPSRAAIQSFAKERWAIKPKGFSEEKEYRLIVTLDSGAEALKPTMKGLQTGYFATPSEVREYCDFRFGDFPDEKFVASITLGPNNRTDETVLRRYLANIGLGDVEVLRSCISYR